MNRREFEKIMAAGAAAAAVPGSLSWASVKEGPLAQVVLTGVRKGSGRETLERAVKRAALEATDFSWLSKGDRVIIKPVLNSGNPYPATTSPAGIKAMVELLLEKGAGKVVVMDMSGVEHVKLVKNGLARGSSRKLMKSSGIAGAAESAGAELYFPEEDGWDAFFEDVPQKGASWKSGVTMPKKIKEADHVILMPRSGRHALAGSSLGMKAAVGWWRTDTRLEYHHDAASFQEKTAEANTVSSLLEKQRLVLTVADKVLTTFGPDRGYCVEPETGLVIASTSLIAHDMTSLAWLLQSREETPEDEKSGLSKDPCQSQVLVANANRVVVIALGGVRAARGTEKLLQNDVNKVMDDRVIKRGCEIFGGRPRIEFARPDRSVPGNLVEKLKQYMAA